MKTSDPYRPSEPVWRLILLVGVMSYGSYTTLVHISMEDGKVPYSSSSVYCITELIKLLYSLAMLLRASSIPLDRSLLLLSVPALLYTINNNLAVAIQTHMDPATYQVLGNLKILISAVLYRIVMKRPVRWLAMLLLFLGGIFNCLGSLPGWSSHSDSVLHLSPEGLGMVLVYCCLSAAAAISTEYYYKQAKEVSIHLQNATLYSLMFLFNCFSWVTLHRSPDTLQWSSPLSGFSVYTWILIATQALSGLTMGAVLKFGSNITRLFVVQSSILVTTLLSMLLFNLHLNLFFELSCVCVLLALTIYYDVINMGKK